MKGSVAQFGVILLRSIEKWTPEQKAAARAELDRKFQAHDDARLLAMACSEIAN